MNQQLEWLHWPDPKSITKGYENLFKYSEEYTKRKQQYPDYQPSDNAIDVALEIEEKGYVKIENFLDTNLIDTLNQKVEEILSDASHNANQSKIAQNDARKNQLYIQVFQPFLNVPEILPFVFNDFIVDVAGAYLDCMPLLSTCNLRKSFINNLPEGGTQIYHIDPNSPRFLKFFIYLNDVDLEGGPFCYVEGSHTKKFKINGVNWNSQYSWNLDSINQIYGQDKVKYLTAKKGDLLVADTNGWHRGTKPINSERTMLTLDYACHPEFFDINQTFQMKKSDFDNLDTKYKPLCDFLKLI
jgi:ectoine hydroxylase-related dioxygenase (phytanoyl-CoA dioxygenase family)